MTGRAEFREKGEISSFYLPKMRTEHRKFYRK